MSFKENVRAIDRFLPIKTSLKYWDRILSHLFEYESRCYLTGSHAQDGDHSSKILSHFQQKFGYLTPGKSLIGTVTTNPRDLQIVSSILRLLPGEIEDPKWGLWSGLELFTKVIAYRNLEIGQSVPCLHIEKGILVPHTYQVDHIFDLWKEMRAFGLTDPQGKYGPILLFRGTDFSLISKGGRASVIIDFDPKGPGRSLYHHIKKPVQHWLQKVLKREQKARVMGFSLGGSLACFALLSSPKYFSTDPDLPSCLFHSPGLPADLHKKWQRLAIKPAIDHFLARGDIVSKIGKLFGNVRELSLPGSLKPITAHTTLYFMNESAKIRPVKIERENRSHSRYEYSKLHKKMSVILYHLGLKHLLPKKDPHEKT